jgi:hypothetical protein
MEMNSASPSPSAASASASVPKTWWHEEEEKLTVAQVPMKK